MASINGTVTYSGGDKKAVEGAVVKISEITDAGAAGKLINSITTKADGKFEFKNLKKDFHYHFSVVVSNAEVRNEGITIVNSPHDMAVEVDGAGSGSGDSTLDAFEMLEDKIKGIPIDAKVSIKEAEQLRRVFTVGNYLLAKVPQSVQVLKDALGDRDSNIHVLYNNLTDDIHKKFREISAKLSAIGNNEDLAMEKVLNDLREQCDLGTNTVESVNTGFKTVYKEFVTLSADEMLAITPEEAAPDNKFWDVTKTEELHRYWQKLIKSVIKLTRNISVAGNMSSVDRVLEWSSVIGKSIDILFDVGKLVMARDDDEKHGWTLLAKLNDTTKSEIKPYLVQAKEGGNMLQYAINMYEQLEKDRESGIEVEDDIDYIGKLLHGKDDASFQLAGTTPSKALRAIATTVLENWPADWE